MQKSAENCCNFFFGNLCCAGRSLVSANALSFKTAQPGRPQPVCQSGRYGDSCFRAQAGQVAGRQHLRSLVHPTPDDARSKHGMRVA